MDTPVTPGAPMGFLVSAAPRASLVALQIALLALGVLAVAAGPGRLPAFNPSERGLAPDGGWRAGDARSLYDLPAYWRALAGAHIAAAIAAADRGDMAAVAQGAAAAAAAAQASLRLEPMNPYAWAALARAERLQARRADALRALARSYDIAPYNAALALSRVLTGYDLWAELSSSQRAAMLSDFRLMKRGAEAEAEALLAETPGARELWALAWALERSPFQPALQP